MTLLPNISHEQVVIAQDTYRHTALAADTYKVSVRMSMIPPSGIAITIAQNGSTKASINSPASAQSIEDLQIVLNCAINDNIDIVINSAVVAEQGINDFKATINIHRGST